MVGVRYVSLCYTITKEELMVFGVSRQHLKGDGEKLAGSDVSFVASSATRFCLFLLRFLVNHLTWYDDLSMDPQTLSNMECARERVRDYIQPHFLAYILHDI